MKQHRYGSAELNHPECVKVLLDKHSASINATNNFGDTALHRAAMKGNLDVVKLLTTYRRCDVSAKNKHNDTPLHCAALAGNDALISVLIQHGAEVNERGKFGRTALHNACSHGHVACIHELMRHGADVEARADEREATPLQMAARSNHRACTRALLEKYSASINTTIS